MMNEDLKPTRTHLKMLNETLDLSIKGHNLLEEKNEALIMEFFSMSKDMETKRKDMEQKLTEAFDSLGNAQATLGHIETQYLGASVTGAPELDISEKKIMGVNLLKINTPDYSKDILERGYNIADSNHHLDNTASLFEESVPKVIKVGEAETNSKILKKEISKTRRKVTALEDFMIPSLERARSSIISKLAERSREDFVRTKMVKKKLR
ncbi:MAG: V-type ATP synthase subunit D [Candidatus Aenigmarchaeota archaeon]|nr:V-type ATP synthase subunit D [Candidatus Aenigmarchaeota archaeon]MCK5290077.1 V-type ATP synthase subunit D [Candidatus Aenigmarchaeota archaeon]MCK5452287.1 V-type ATP synthase subunit D [Candidatus Aenigmarchaeota archaeon]